MNEDGHVVVIVGAGSEMGRELGSVLRERAFPVADWRLYDDAPEDQAFDDDEIGAEIFSLSEADLEAADVVFLCGGVTPASEWVARAADAGALLIDLTYALAESADAALVVPEVNAAAIADGLERGLLACPLPNAVALSVLLKPLETAVELKRVVVTTFEPVSAAGRLGIDELVEQTRGLLSGGSPERTVFPHRIAFNIIPQVGDFVSGGRTRGEWLLESQTRRILDLPDLPITVTSVYIPAFFGQACVVNVETAAPLDATAARTLLRHSPGLLVCDREDDYPTLADIIGSEATHIGRVRDDPTVPYGLAMFVAIDGLRKGGAVNAVQIAERAMRERA
jgi:aspartate-semialdehyde dehydrogenase